MQKLILFLIIFTSTSIIYAQNTSFGFGSGTSGLNCSFFGVNAGTSNGGGPQSSSAGYYNTFIGHNSGQGNATGDNNTFIGNDAGFTNLSGDANTFIGGNAGYLGFFGEGNTALGYNAGYSNDSYFNTFIGHDAGYANDSGLHNTMLGKGAGAATTSSSYNVFVGQNAGKNTTGNNNVSVGYYAGESAGNNNVFLGNRAGANETGDNKLYIDNSDISTPLIFGDFATNRVGINTNNPQESLDVDGNANVRGNFLDVGQDAGATAAYLRIGSGRTANGIAAIDCIGTLNYPLYGFRFGHTGTGSSIIFHRGTNPFLIQATEAASIYFRTASTNRVAITSTGKMGIGTTNPNASTLLDVAGVIGYNGTMINTSDKRLKTNEKEFAYGLNEVLTLSPIYYNYNGKAGTDSEPTHVGIYAQDLREIAPELVGEFKYQETEIEVLENDKEIDVKANTNKSAEAYLHINESSIKYMLINAVKEQQDIIETQEEELKTIRQEMAEMKEMMQVILNGQNTDINQQNIQLDGRGAYLKQNQPNPFSSNTLIKYHIPTDANKAVINIFDSNTQIIHSERIAQTGVGEIQIKAGTIPAGMYSYSLVVNGQVSDTKRMVIVK